MKLMIAVIMASFLFNMGTFNMVPSAAVAPIVSDVPSPEISANTVDLNELMLSEFVNWDAFMTRYFSINATTTDIYDYSRVAGGYSTARTLSGIGFYLSSLAAMYENTGDEYYLAKMRTFIDWMIDDPWFYTDVQGIGEIFSVPGYYYDGDDHDTSCMYTMNVGIQSLKLWEWTSEEKYKSLAERIANESVRLVVVNNSTDMAWSSQYYRLRELENARNGINRQGAIAWFYALYAQKINSSHAAYIPRIVNWMWRAQLPSGGLAYDIGQTSPNTPYSSYAVLFVLRAYAIQPGVFSSALKEKIAETIQWLSNKAQLSLSYLGTVYGSCALGAAWKTEYFVGNVSVQQVKSFIYVVLSSFHYSTLGLAATIADFPFGWRWSSGSTGLFFSLYPLPNGTFSPDDVAGVSYYERTTGRYVPTGWMLNYMGNCITDGSDLHGVSFTQSTNEVFFLKAEGLAPTSRNITNFGHYMRVKTSYPSNQNISLYAYPTGIYVADVKGTNNMVLRLDYKAGLNGWKCTADNGTTFTLSDLSSDTYQKLGTKYMLWLNSTETSMRRTFFISSPSSTWYYSTIDTDRMLLSTSETNYRMISALSLNWGPARNLSQEYQTLSSMIDFYNVSQPLPFSLVLSSQYETLDSLLTTPKWLNTYKNAVSSDARLIAHNSPETIHITDWKWDSGFNRLMFTVDETPETISITKIYCSNNSEPTAVYATNGTLAWSYNASTMVLTLNVVHDGSVNILVDWTRADVTPPVVGAIDRSPTWYNTSVTIVVNLTDLESGMYNAILSYSSDSEWINITMVREAGSYVVVIPAFTYGTVVKYRLYACDHAGNWRTTEVFSYNVTDETAPEVGVPEWGPTSPSPGQPVLVQVSVAEPENASGLDSVTLWFYLDEDFRQLQSIRMTFENGLWRAEIPSQSEGRIVAFFIRAEDKAGNVGTTEGYRYNVGRSGIVPWHILVFGLVLTTIGIGAGFYFVKFRKARRVGLQQGLRI